MSELTTARLLLRQWRPGDLGPFAALNADPDVMRYFPAALRTGESDQFAARIQAMLGQQGWGLWAVEVVGGAPFIGFVGLNRTRFDAPFTPAVEVGWRLARPYWGYGYATEAAAASLTFGFDQLGCEEIVSLPPASTTRRGGSCSAWEWSTVPRTISIIRPFLTVLFGGTFCTEYRARTGGRPETNHPAVEPG